MRLPVGRPLWLAVSQPKTSQQSLCSFCTAIPRPWAVPSPRRPLSLAMHAAAAFATSAQRGIKHMPPRPKPPPEEEIEEIFVKGSGPGGQKINKTNSAVQLLHRPTGLVVKSQATRSRTQNRKIARDKLALRLDEMRNGDQSRTAIVGDSKRRKRASADKKSRRKYRKLEESKLQEEGGEDMEDMEAVEGIVDAEEVKDVRDLKTAEADEAAAETNSQEGGDKKVERKESSVP